MKKLLNCILFALAVLSAAGLHAQNKDWANLKRYEKDNLRLAQEANSGKRVVFMGNSITEGWVRCHPDFFRKNGYIGRGISGQTSYQFLVRFRQDVINLAPVAVVINAGTNDIAENTGPYNEDYTFGNIVSMVELAKANRIEVVLTSILPAAAFGWRKSITDAPQKIASLNARLKKYAAKNKILFVDYYSAMVVGKEKALSADFTEDGVHPTSKGYDVMEPLVQKALHKILPSASR